MVGSTFIAENDSSKLAALADDADSLNDFVHVDLDHMLTLDFTVMLPSGISWDDGDPVHFDEEGGLAICKISEAGLTHVLTHPEACPAEHRGDLQKLAAFIEQHGKSNIYELSTF